MIIDFEYKNQKLIISYIDKTGNIKLKYYPWSKPTKMITTSDDDPDKSGRFVTWDGTSVKEVYTKYPNKYAIYDFIDELPKEELDILFEYTEPNIFFVDIENEILDKKPEPQKAESAIQTISIVNKNKVLVIGTAPLDESQIKSINEDINLYFKKFNPNYEFKYIRYKSEYDMLLNFFKVMVPKMSAITGWNFIGYDWVFLVNRARNIGIDPTLSSFTGVLKKSYKENDFKELPAHRIIVDYMELYQKWDTAVKVKESSALDFVSEKILGLKKVNYEGNLTQLYENDYKKFVFYNAVDSILVQKIHDKMRYIDILYGISTLSRVPVTSAFSTLAITEGAMRKKLKDEKNIVLCKLEDSSDDESDVGVKGGFVKDPVKGMATWTTCYDFASLYPTVMRQFNISPDSYRGQKIKGKNMTLFNGHQLQIEDDDIVCINGAVFKDDQSIVRDVLSHIYLERKKYKKQMIIAFKEMEELVKELEELENS